MSKITVTIDTDLCMVAPIEPTLRMLIDGYVGRMAYNAILAAVPAELPGVVEHNEEPVAWVNRRSLERETEFTVMGAPEGDCLSLFTHPPAQPDRRVEAQAQQLRYALHSLQKIAGGLQSPEDHAAIAIKHIACGTYVPEPTDGEQLQNSMQFGSDMVSKYSAVCKELSAIKRVAECGSVTSFLSLSDDEKRKWFAIGIDESTRRKKADEQVEALQARIAELETEMLKVKRVNGSLLLQKVTWELHLAAQAGAEFKSGCNDIGACGCKTPCDMPKEPAPANAAQEGQAGQEPVASERPINDWLALTIRNTAFAEAAELFPQPFVDYDGHTIQAKIRAQISQYATLNLRPTLSNSEIDCITSSFKQSDHHDSIRACITAAFTSPQKLVPSPPAQARQEPVNIPVMVRAWHAAEQERLDCVVAYNVAIESVKKHEWPGPCTDREYQAMTAAANKAHALKAPMHEQMKEMIYPAVPPAPANALAIVQAAIEAACDAVVDNCEEWPGAVDAIRALDPQAILYEVIK